MEIKMITYILSGLLGVTNMILWGLYGDLLVEKFNVVKVLRSIIIGILWSILLFFLNPHLPLLIVALVVISLERITTEIYKALLRVENQDKYQIPSDLGIKANHTLKFVIGVFLILIIGALVYHIEIPIDKIYLILIIGFFIALGGMLKDAPHEGFDKIKFFRSPLVTIIVGLSINFLFPDISGKFFLLSIAGGERIISEFYKKIFRGRIPGKFKQKEFNQIWMKQRKKLLALYFLDIIGLIILVFI
jgi:hypothetical protein